MRNHIYLWKFVPFSMSKYYPLQNFNPKIFSNSASPSTLAGVTKHTKCWNSYKNVVGTYKRPGARTGAHLKCFKFSWKYHWNPQKPRRSPHLTCCNFSRKWSRLPKFIPKSPTGAHTGARLKWCKFSRPEPKIHPLGNILFLNEGKG